MDVTKKGLCIDIVLMDIDSRLTRGLYYADIRFRSKLWTRIDRNLKEPMSIWYPRIRMQENTLDQTSSLDRAACERS